MVAMMGKSNAAGVPTNRWLNYLKVVVTVMMMYSGLFLASSSIAHIYLVE